MRTIWGKDSNSNKIIDNGFIAGNRGLEAVYILWVQGKHGAIAMTWSVDVMECLRTHGSSRLSYLRVDGSLGQSGSVLTSH